MAALADRRNVLLLLILSRGLSIYLSAAWF